MGMKKKIAKILKFILVALLTIAIAVYLTIAMTSMTSPDPEEVCTGVAINIEDSHKADFIDRNTITSILKEAKLHPKGQKMTNVNTRKIESYLRQNKFIERVDCHKSVSGQFCINVTQRVPAIYIMPDSSGCYFIDRNGISIPNTIYKTNLVVATGDIDKKYAEKELLPFALFIQENPFWNNQIEQIHISRNSENRRVALLVPRVGNHIVKMGEVRNFEKKLKRLKTFYEKAIGTVGWNKYSTINIQYDNQIICTKHKN